MFVIVLLIVVSLTLAVGFLTLFIWAVRSGQFEDTCTPSMRILTEDQAGRGLKPAFGPASASSAASGASNLDLTDQARNQVSTNRNRTDRQPS